MARLHRLYLVGCAKHVVQHDINREARCYEEAESMTLTSLIGLH